MSTVSYAILGPLDVTVDGHDTALGGPKQRATLAVLLLHAGALVPATRLIDTLWGDDPPASAVNLVQGYISGLRKTLGKDAIETRGPGYVLRAAADAVDLHRFERLTHDGTHALENGQLEKAAALLGEALSLWRGPALADLGDEPGLQPAASRLEELRVLALERRIEALSSSAVTPTASPRSRTWSSSTRFGSARVAC